MSEYLCIIQARTSSSRLPAKVMLDLGGKTLIERVIESVSVSEKVTKVIVATSVERSDDIIEEKLLTLKREVYRGSLKNVLERFYKAAELHNAKHIIRVTADNPLTDGKLIDELIHAYEKSASDYAMINGLPKGVASEIFSFESLKKAYENAVDTFEQEHVTPYIKKHGKTLELEAKQEYKRPDESVTVDTLDDYIKMKKFYLYCNKTETTPSIDNYLQYKKTADTR